MNQQRMSDKYQVGIFILFDKFEKIEGMKDNAHNVNLNVCNTVRSLLWWKTK